MLLVPQGGVQAPGHGGLRDAQVLGHLLLGHPGLGQGHGRGTGVRAARTHGTQQTQQGARAFGPLAAAHGGATGVLCGLDRLAGRHEGRPGVLPRRVGERTVHLSDAESHVPRAVVGQGDGGLQGGRGIVVEGLELVPGGDVPRHQRAGQVPAARVEVLTHVQPLGVRAGVATVHGQCKHEPLLSVMRSHMHSR